MRNIFCILGICIVSLAGCAGPKGPLTSNPSYEGNFIVDPKLEIDKPCKKINRVKKTKKARREKIEKNKKCQKKEDLNVLDLHKPDEETINFSTSEIWMH